MIRFELPLHVCPTLNELNNMHWAKKKRIKDECKVRMLAQHGRRKKPLSGRIKIVATRFSSKEPDEDSAWTKFPVDALKVKGGLGWIEDDSPMYIEVKRQWTKSSPGWGVVVLEILDS